MKLWNVCLFQECNFIYVSNRSLILRRWGSKDLEPFTKINSDLKVMEFFPSPLSFQETKDFVKSIEQKIERNGFGFWATELRETKELIGCIGLSIPNSPLPFSPCVEIGWRLAQLHWGKGYAQEGARTALKFGFEKLKSKEIVSFTTVGNKPSRNVMEKIGMTYDPSADFLHPELPQNHPLAPHVLYRINDATLNQK